MTDEERRKLVRLAFGRGLTLGWQMCRKIVCKAMEEFPGLSAEARLRIVLQLLFEYEPRFTAEADDTESPPPPPSRPH